MDSPAMLFFLSLLIAISANQPFLADQDRLLGNIRSFYTQNPTPENMTGTENYDGIILNNGTGPLVGVGNTRHNQTHQTAGFHIVNDEGHWMRSYSLGGSSRFEDALSICSFRSGSYVAVGCGRLSDYNMEGSLRNSDSEGQSPDQTILYGYSSSTQVFTSIACNSQTSAITGGFSNYSTTPNSISGRNSYYAKYNVQDKTIEDAMLIQSAMDSEVRDLDSNEQNSTLSVNWVYNDNSRTSYLHLFDSQMSRLWSRQALPIQTGDIKSIDLYSVKGTGSSFVFGGTAQFNKNPNLSQLMHSYGFVGKVSSSGSIEWASYYKPTIPLKFDILTIEVLSDGNIMIAGHFNYSPFYAKLSSSGQIIQKKILNFPGTISSVKEFSDGSLAIFGTKFVFDSQGNHISNISFTGKAQPNLKLIINGVISQNINLEQIDAINDISLETKASTIFQLPPPDKNVPPQYKYTYYNITHQNNTSSNPTLPPRDDPQQQTTSSNLTPGQISVAVIVPFAALVLIIISIVLIRRKCKKQRETKVDPEQLEHHKDNSIDQFDIEVIEMEDEDVSNNKSESIESQEEEVGEKEEVEEDQGSN